MAASVYVELPLALSVIMAGLRTALVFSIGIATIGTFIGAGGLGILLLGEQMLQMVRLLF